MFQMNVDGLEWILFVEIATSFPAVQPALRLQVDPEIPQHVQQTDEVFDDKLGNTWIWSPSPAPGWGGGGGGRASRLFCLLLKVSRRYAGP